MELTGFMTQRLSVKKAETEHIPGIVRLYGLDDIELKKQFALKWKEIIEKEQDDSQNDVTTFVIRSRRKKTVGLIRTKVVGNNGIEIKIWLSTPERIKKYQKHLAASLVEYYSDYEDFDYISKIEIIKRDNDHYITEKILEKVIL